MGKIRIGISGWSYDAWRGDFYPANLPRRGELGYASRRLGSIEINGSFYRLQTPSTYKRWYEETPPGFLFAVKGSRFITHNKKLADVENALAATRSLEQRREVLELAVEQNRRALELENAAYRVGRNDLRDVLRQQVALYGSSTALLAVRGDQLVQRVNLHLALGGSFEPVAAPEETDDGNGAEDAVAVAGQ